MSDILLWISGSVVLALVFAALWLFLFRPSLSLKDKILFLFFCLGAYFVVLLMFLAPWFFV